MIKPEDLAKDLKEYLDKNEVEELTQEEIENIVLDLILDRKVVDAVFFIAVGLSIAIAAIISVGLLALGIYMIHLNHIYAGGFEAALGCFFLIDTIRFVSTKKYINKLHEEFLEFLKEEKSQK